jgi:hypothetical protein
MTQNIRTLTRCIWVGVRESPNSSAGGIVEKTSVINLLIAFAYATKNYLREEYSYDSDGIKELINHIPKFCTPSSNQPLDLQKVSNPGQVTVTVTCDPEVQKSGVLLVPRKLSSSKPNGPATITKDRRKSSVFEKTRRATLSQRQTRQLSFTAHDCVR